MYIRFILIEILYGITILTSYIAFPLLYPFGKWILKYKIPVLFIFFDEEDGLYGSKLWRLQRGLKKNFWAALRWSWRNPAWNFHYYFKPRQGTPQAIKVRGELWKGRLQESYYSLANIKTTDAEGNYTGNFGKYFSGKYSTLGSMHLVYEVKGKRYFRYSKAWYSSKLNRWIEFQIGTNDFRYILKFKIMNLDVILDVIW